MKFVYAACFAFALVACQDVPPAQSSPRTSRSDAVEKRAKMLSPLAAQGRALAEESCSACHAIDTAIASPNSNAPLFPVIVNQEGVSSETLSYWLRGAHNYPSEMDFYLDAQKVDALVAYMLTLQDPNYERPVD
ncbi:c-type cytochrome [Sphingomonas edaphi]|nr:cytochrome c [Sphingomonas edaphi]